MNPDQALLFDWLHDGLDPTQLAVVAERLRREPVLRQQLAQLALGEAALVQALRDGDAARSQARRAVSPRSRRRRSRPRQAWWLLPGLGLAAAAIVAVLVLRPTPSAPVAEPVVTQQAEAGRESVAPAIGNDWDLGGGRRLIARSDSIWAGDSNQPILQSGAASLEVAATASEPLSLRTPHGTVSLDAGAQQLDLEVIGNTTLLAQHAGSSQVQTNEHRYPLTPGAALILRSDVDRRLSPVTWLWSAGRPAADIEMSGAIATIATRRVLESSGSDFGHEGWRPDQHLGLWVDGRSLIQPSPNRPNAARLRLILHAERAGQLTVTLALAEPRQIENEHNYLNLTVTTGWQVLDLPLHSFQRPAAARSATEHPINAIGLWGQGAGRLGLATASFDTHGPRP